MRSWLSRLLNRRPASVRGPVDGIIETECTASRRLPWGAPTGPLADANPEARFKHRLRLGTEIAAGFDMLAGYFARKLEYGWTGRRTLASDRVLDVGSGKTDFPAWLSKHTASVIAVDLQDFSAEHDAIRSRTGSRYGWQREDATAMSFADDSFDAVVCVSVVEHIPSPHDSAAVREMVRVCRPGGRVLITAPYSHPGTIEDPKHPEGLQRYYGPAELFGRLVPLGSSVRDLTYMVYGMPEEGGRSRFGRPEESGVFGLCIEKT